MLKVISERETSAFVPAGQGAAQAQRFDRLVESLLRLQRLGWITLEISARRSVGRGRSKYVGATAQCTAEGRRVLAFIGEGGT
ncbi:MAG: hypothetical protein ACTHQQ_02925 [Solirubrobacteraceae bacterium]